MTTRAPALVTRLMRHQHEGVTFLLERKRGILALEQGLGKSAVAIAAFDQLLGSNLSDSMLVVCPNSLKRNWVAEFARHAPRIVCAIVEGDRRERLSSISGANADVIIMSYETARAEPLALGTMLGRRRYTLVLDESHFAKNHLSRSSRVAQHIAPRVEYCWLLSGTPVTNTAEDLYTQLGIVGATASLGSRADFRERYVPPPRTPPLKAARREELAAAVAADVFRRTKAECLDLAEKTFVDIEIELPPWQRDMYVSARDSLAGEVAGMSTAQFRAFIPTALTRLLRLTQIASNPSLVSPGELRTPGKFSELDDVLAELFIDPTQKVIIWSHYVRTIEQLAARYASLGTSALHGAVPVDERHQIAERFQHNAELRLLVANPAAAGTGLTLTAATVAIYETLSWRYDFFAQSQDRIHRIGQTLPVTYLRLLASDTVDRAMADALELKTLLARELIGDIAVEQAFADLTPHQFAELVRQGRLPL